MKVQIDREGCISCGLCVATCPEVFTIADDGLAEAIENPPAEHIEKIKEAADGCPTSVIKI